MKKVILIGIIIGVALSTIVFLAFAFANWNINPSNWSSDVRAYCSFIMAILFLSGVGFYIGMESESRLYTIK